MKVLIEDTRQDWIRIYRYIKGHTEIELLFEGHPGDIELDVLLSKMDIQVEMEYLS